MSLIHNIHKECTDHTYGTCASCGYIAVSPWSEYLRKIPFEEQLEIIEMEEGPFGRILSAPEGTPPYLGALMKDAEMYPIDRMVSDTSCESISCIKLSGTKKPRDTNLKSVFISRREYKTYCKKKPSKMKRDTRSRKKQSWKKAHYEKKCVEPDDFLIPEGRTFPKYTSRIRKWCRCCNSIVKMGRYNLVCRSCRKDRCYNCGIFSEVTPFCTDCQDFFIENRGIVTVEDVRVLKQEWLEQSFTFVKRQPKYELCFFLRNICVTHVSIRKI